MYGQTPPDALARPGPVRRLTFAYDGDRISLVSEQHVRMIVPPTQPLEATAEQAGFSVIVRDAQDRPVYRFARTSPFRHDTEVFSDQDDESIRRVAVDHPKGMFVLLVPEVAGATTLELSGHALRPQSQQAKPQSLLRLTLAPFNWKRGDHEHL